MMSENLKIRTKINYKKSVYVPSLHEDTKNLSEIIKINKFSK